MTKRQTPTKAKVRRRMTAANESNKGYKFKFEQVIEVLPSKEDDHVGGRALIFTGYGDTAKEAIDNEEKVKTLGIN